MAITTKLFTASGTNYKLDEGLEVHKDFSVTYDAKNPIASLSYSQDKILLNAISFQDVLNKKERIIDLDKASPWKPLTRCIAIQTKKRLRSDEDRALELEMKCRNYQMMLQNVLRTIHNYLKLSCSQEASGKKQKNLLLP